MRCACLPLALIGLLSLVLLFGACIRLASAQEPTETPTPTPTPTATPTVTPMPAATLEPTVTLGEATIAGMLIVTNALLAFATFLLMVRRRRWK
jgi:hypothetical protein